MVNGRKVWRKKIFSNPRLRGTALILVKETYLSLRNFYGLLTHPFKTIVRIRKKPDWSQTFLVLGMPVWTGLAVFAALAGAGVGIWFLRPARSRLLELAGIGLALSLFLIFITAAYFFYWTGKYLVWKRKLRLESKGRNDD